MMETLKRETSDFDERV
nr:hypothetical protein [Deinococcus planocerae]